MVDVWKTLKSEMVAQCWMRCEILPPYIEAELANFYGKATISNTEDAKGPLPDRGKLFNDSKLELSSTWPKAFGEDVTEEEIINWVDVEEDESVAEVLRQDLVGEMDNRIMETILG